MVVSSPSLCWIRSKTTANHKASKSVALLKVLKVLKDRKAETVSNNLISLLKQQLHWTGPLTMNAAVRFDSDADLICMQEFFRPSRSGRISEINQDDIAFEARN